MDNPNPIRTATIPADSSNPAMVLIQFTPGASISYASIHCEPDQAIDILRRALIHLVADQAGLATVPAHAAITANGHGLKPAPEGSRVLVGPPDPGDIPPLRVPKTKPATERRKPGTPRRRKIDVKEW